MVNVLNMMPAKHQHVNIVSVSTHNHLAQSKPLCLQCVQPHTDVILAVDPCHIHTVLAKELLYLTVCVLLNIF